MRDKSLGAFVVCVAMAVGFVRAGRLKHERK
jgi:hypothetical protein